MKANGNWTETWFRKLNPGYRHRGEVYDEFLCKCITKETVWLDVGCGKNAHVAAYGQMARSSLGIDKLDYQDRADAPFLQTDFRSIPLPSSSVDLVSMRLVVEHLEKIPDDISEIDRVLKPGGRVIVLTTNSLSPLIFLPRLLPFGVKNWIIRKMFGVGSNEVFPTYHRFNTPRKMAKGFGGLRLSRIEFLEQVPLDKPLLTFMFGLWYCIVKFSPLKWLRSNLLAEYEKRTVQVGIRLMGC
jgi:ubiquinone/menaquinone biosynthesis C-methylase UbiE